MDNSLKIRCKNNNKVITAPLGSTLSEVYAASGLDMEYGPMAALVNNKVQGMNFRFYNNKDVEFLSLYSMTGMRTYVRTLFLVLVKAAEDLYPDKKLLISAPVNGGFYCELCLDREISEEDISSLRLRMQEIIAEDLPISDTQCPVEEAIELFSEKNMKSKVKLLESIDKLYTDYNKLGDTVGNFYSCLLTHTGQLHLFDLVYYMDGMLLRVPSLKDPSKLENTTEQSQMVDVIREHHRWQDILGIRNVGDFNMAVMSGHATELINVSEALQDKKLNHIVDEIAERHSRLVLIAGPSSSGKTTTSKRLAILLMACGLKPYTLSTDDYFVNRVDTPLDEKGEYDFECIQAVDTKFFNQQMNELLEGKEVELPRYDFQSGQRVFEGKKLKIVGGSDFHYDILVTNFIGNPTTWVYAESNSPKDILAGIKAGHTTISERTKSGTFITLTCGDAICGDTVKFVEGATVTATVVKNGKGKKIRIFKYNPKKGYRKRQGHRQPYTKVEICKVIG